MKSELSALHDGELDPIDAAAVLARLRQDEALRRTWNDYQLIGDALRSEPPLAADLTARVMARLDDEPVVLSPQSRRRAKRWQRSVMALAAALSGVAVVGWMALQPQEPDALPVAATVARLDSAPVKAVSLSASEANAAELREYLAAHQAQTGALPFQGNTQQIRTVSLAVGE